MSDSVTPPYAGQDAPPVTGGGVIPEYHCEARLMDKRSINEILEQGVHVNTEIPVIVEALREARVVLVRAANLERVGPDCDQLLKKWDSHE